MLASILTILAVIVTALQFLGVMQETKISLAITETNLDLSRGPSALHS